LYFDIEFFESMSRSAIGIGIASTEASAYVEAALNVEEVGAKKRLKAQRTSSLCSLRGRGRLYRFPVRQLPVCESQFHL
jgi:hypothetical protein